jgi:Transposase DDE domain
MASGLGWIVGVTAISICFLACEQILRCMIFHLRPQESVKLVVHENMAHVWGQWMIVLLDGRKMSQTYTVFLYGKKREVQAYSQAVMLKTMKCPVRVVWVYRKTRYVALMTTDLTLSVEQIIDFYGARWKIESGFKEIKQDIGSSKSQVRNADAVLNHLNFCMMATTLTWVYADHLQTAPDRK